MGNGILMVLGMPTVCRLRKIHKHTHEITCIRFSPNGLYMAAGDIKGNIFIFNIMQCYFVMFRLHAKAGNITLDWHPWTGVDLAICKTYNPKLTIYFIIYIIYNRLISAESCPPSISIFSMPRAEIAAFYQRLDTKIVINKITFNKITGELLVNICKRGKMKSNNFTHINIHCFLARWCGSFVQRNVGAFLTESCCWYLGKPWAGLDLYDVEPRWHQARHSWPGRVVFGVGILLQGSIEEQT